MNKTFSYSCLKKVINLCIIFFAAAMNSCEHKKYLNGGHYPVNGNISNGHIGHHSHHSRNYRHQSSGQSLSKPYAFNDMIESYTSAPACSKSLHMVCSYYFLILFIF